MITLLMERSRSSLGEPSDPNTELYTKVLLKMTLNLGDYHNPQSAKTIQCRTMTIQLAESFEFRPNAELLLLVNSSVNKGEIDSWNAFANKYKIQMMIWNLSLYDGFSYFLQLGDLNFIEMLKQKMVIVLNNPFKLDTAENQRVSNMIPQKEFIEAAKNHQISTMFLSESSQTCLSNFMIPLEKPSPPRIWKKFKDLIKARKAEWLGLINRKKIPKKADLNQVQTLPKYAKVVECYEGIKERFKVSPNASRNTLSTRERRSLRSRGENFLENIEEEKDHLKSSDFLDSNKQESLIPPHMEQEQEEKNDILEGTQEEFSKI